MPRRLPCRPFCEGRAPSPAAAAARRGAGRSGPGADPLQASPDGRPEVRVRRAGRSPAKPREPYALAVVPLEFTDRKLGDPAKTETLFRGLTDYYAAASSGRFKLDLKPGDKVALPVGRNAFERKDLEKA